MAVPNGVGYRTRRCLVRGSPPIPDAERRQQAPRGEGVPSEVPVRWPGSTHGAFTPCRATFGPDAVQTGFSSLWVFSILLTRRGADRWIRRTANQRLIVDAPSPASDARNTHGYVLIICAHAADQVRLSTEDAVLAWRAGLAQRPVSRGGAVLGHTDNPTGYGSGSASSSSPALLITSSRTRSWPSKSSSALTSTTQSKPPPHTPGPERHHRDPSPVRRRSNILTDSPSAAGSGCQRPGSIPLATS